MITYCQDFTDLLTDFLKYPANYFSHVRFWLGIETSH